MYCWQKSAVNEPKTKQNKTKNQKEVPEFLSLNFKAQTVHDKV